MTELAELGCTNLVQLNRAVAFEGDLRQLYKANICLRTALRILVPISSFQAHNDRHLYALSGKINWEKYIGIDQTFAIDATVNGSRFTHSQYAALKVKDAIVDQFKARHGKRPSVHTSNPDVRINLHISETDVQLALDSSGESLEKRGYRTESNEAPISEVLAAGLLKLAAYNGEKPLLDPMCGSGTIAIEAALMASQTAPGLHREFAFQRWPDFDAGIFKQLDFECRSAIKSPSSPILARDMDARNISISKRNAARAGVIDYIQFDLADFLEAAPPAVPTMVIMNPPYGERLDDDAEMDEFYHKIGFKLKHEYAGHTAWVISGNLRAMKRLGLKPSKRIKLFNGKIECRFAGFDLFEGKAKAHGFGKQIDS